MRHLLLLAYAFPPDNTVGAIRPGRLKQYLPDLGYQPHVVASSFEGQKNDDQLVDRVPDGHEPKHIGVASGLLSRLMTHLAPYNDRLPWIPYASHRGAKVIVEHGVKAIFSTSPFLASHFAALVLKWRFGLPWVADFRDPIRDNPFRSRRWLYPYDTMVEGLFFRFADRLIANTDTVADAWRRRYPQYADKISILWNGFDPHEDVLVAERPKRSHRVVAHVGTLYDDRHPGRFLATLERLQVDPSDVRVKLVGPIDRTLLQRFRPLFDRLVQQGVLEYGNRLVDRAEALRETAEADYLLLLDLNAKNATFQLPSKLFEYVRYGKPILAYTPKSSPAERILADSGPAFVAIDPTESEVSELDKVSTFLRLPTETKPVTAKFEETFNAQSQAKILACMLDGLLEK